MRKILFLVIIVALNLNLLAQKTIESPEKEAEETLIFKHKVKLLDDFFDRFNYKRTFEGERIKDVENFAYDRKFMIKTLFDYNFYLKDTLLISKFINSIIKDSTYLDFYENNWYSVVNATVNYLGEEHSIALKMQIESQKPDNRSKWIIKDVDAPFISLTKNNSTNFIHPVAHETNFISLADAFENNRQIAEYTDSNFVANKLSIFLFLVKEEKIKFTQISNISYVFNLQKWNFSVSSFNRMEHNAGWLINYLEKNKNYVEVKKEKKKLLEKDKTNNIISNENEVIKNKKKQKTIKNKNKRNKRK